MYSEYWIIFWVYSDTLINSKPNLLRNVVPTIAIKNLKASNGAGPDTNPYEVTKWKSLQFLQ